MWVLSKLVDSAKNGTGIFLECSFNLIKNLALSTIWIDVVSLLRQDLHREASDLPQHLLRRKAVPWCDRPPKHALKWDLPMTEWEMWPCETVQFDGALRSAHSGSERIRHCCFTARAGEHNSDRSSAFSRSLCCDQCSAASCSLNLHVRELLAYAVAFFLVFFAVRNPFWVEKVYQSCFFVSAVKKRKVFGLVIPLDVSFV